MEHWALGLQSGYVVCVHVEAAGERAFFGTGSAADSEEESLLGACWLAANLLRVRERERETDKAAGLEAYPPSASSK